jgi:hypothetical protein
MVWVGEFEPGLKVEGSCQRSYQSIQSVMEQLWLGKLDGLVESDSMEGKARKSILVVAQYVCFSGIPMRAAPVLFHVNMVYIVRNVPRS